MDSISHSVHGIIIFRLFDFYIVKEPLDLYTLILGYFLFALVGFSADLIGWLGRLKDKDDWRWYLEAHHNENSYMALMMLALITLSLKFFGVLYSVPNQVAFTLYCYLTALLGSYCLHTVLDSFTHGEGKRWWVKGERLDWEIYSIFISLLLIYFYFI